MSFGDLSGPHSVGFRDESLDDSGLCFRLFYPISPPPPSVLVSTPWIINSNYLKSIISFGLGRDLGSFWCSIIHWIIRYPHLPISEGASPKAGPFPLVLFSHGLGGSRMAYSKLATHIASYGFVVASLEHLDGSASLAHQAPDKWIPYQPPQDVQKSLPFRSAQIDTRVQELKHVREFLNDKPFVDVNKTILCGHSFGAATILTLLKEEPSMYLGGVAYDVYIDPLAEKPDVMSQAPVLTQNTLFINNELFIKKVNQELLKQFDQGHHNNIWTIKETLHYCQSDIPTVVKNARCLPYFINGRMDLKKDQEGFDFSVQAFVHYVKSKLLKENPSSFDEFIEDKKEILIEGF